MGTNWVLMSLMNVLAMSDFISVGHGNVSFFAHAVASVTVLSKLT